VSFFKQIPFWENRKRVSELKAFKELVQAYSQNITYDDFLLGISENNKAKEIRSKINSMLDKAHQDILLARINPTLRYSPPPSIGGLSADIDLVINIFHLHRFEISFEHLLDYIERAIGIYEDDRFKSLFRTLSPFYWLDVLFRYIAKLPFEIMGEIGFDQSKIEATPLGKIIKGILYLIQVAAAFLVLLEKLGYLESFKQFLKLI